MKTLQARPTVHRTTRYPVIYIAMKDRKAVSTFRAPSIFIPGGEQMKQTLNGKIIISFHFITDEDESG